MSMTDVMEDVDYRLKKFNKNEAIDRHPLFMTDSHFIYHLCYDDRGHLVCAKNKNGDSVCSPRYLLQLCMTKLVRDTQRLKQMNVSRVPAGLYTTLLMEAIFQRELQAVVYLVSTWPLPVFNIYNCLPLEDYIDPGYLTLPIEGAGSMSLIDSVMLGVLNLRPESKLKVIDVTGFETDRKVCRELSRLPIIWMKYSERRAVKIHDLISDVVDISIEKLQRYINRISCIYSSMDIYIKHGNKIGPVNILWDCKVTLDDVPIGLALQFHSPFRFSSRKIWSKPIAEICLPFRMYPKMLDPRTITHLEVEDEKLCVDLSTFDSLQECLLLLPNLTALSLPNTIHVDVHEQAAYELNHTLRSLTRLQKLNFSSCFLKDNLCLLLEGLDVDLTYLNLRDCRLSHSDLEYLTQWKPLEYLQELNLSRNNFKTLTVMCLAMLFRMKTLTCFSVSYCSFSPLGLRQVVQGCQELHCLKVLCIKSFTPPPLGDIREIIEDCAMIPSLQKFAILPEAYAFPGGDEYSRSVNRESLATLCSHFLIHQDRIDVEVE